MQTGVGRAIPPADTAFEDVPLLIADGLCLC